MTERSTRKTAAWVLGIAVAVAATVATIRNRRSEGEPVVAEASVPVANGAEVELVDDAAGGRVEMSPEKAAAPMPEPAAQPGKLQVDVVYADGAPAQGTTVVAFNPEAVDAYAVADAQGQVELALAPATTSVDLVVLRDSAALCQRPSRR